MAMQIGTKGVQSDINVTPLIDVVLVMLIIFMVLTPTLEARFSLALPEAEPAPEEPPPESEQALLVFLDAQGGITLNGEGVDRRTLVEKLRVTLRRREDKVAFFDADDSASYETAVQLMDLCREAGAEHIGVVDPEALPQDGLPEVGE